MKIEIVNKTGLTEHEVFVLLAKVYEVGNDEIKKDVPGWVIANCKFNSKEIEVAISERQGNTTMFIDYHIEMD
jgi:hypothetical protein